MGINTLKLRNCRLDEAKERFAGKRIVFFGKGTWLNNIDYTELMGLQSYFSYVIDNNPEGDVLLGNNLLHVYEPARIENERNIVIILTSPVYMYEMFIQLERMSLHESIECYAFPFMQMITTHKCDYFSAYRGKQAKIPKVIHSFWFSGDEKTDAYRMCLDSWSKVLSDYEIIEWNMSNYNWHKNAFVEKAIEYKAWAFASDYARIDVLDDFGGIYLDMDVEVFKSFDDLLGNEMILSFSNNISIDLAVMASIKSNPLLKQLKSLYEDVDIPSNREGFSKFFQPAFVRKTLAENGITMNGTLQKCKYATVFPSEFFMPQDHVIFAPPKITENTYCIHYDNFGWSFSKDNKREKKIRENNLLWQLIRE